MAGVRVPVWNQGLNCLRMKMMKANNMWNRELSRRLPGRRDLNCIANTVYRTRCLDGPDYRLAPGEESAVKRALRLAASREDNSRAIFLPSQGTTFRSAEEAREYYNLYSWEIGFGIRNGRSRKNTKKYRTKVEYACSCEGFDSDPNAKSCRVGCKAMIRLLRTEDHGWYVSRFIEEHNHPFSETYAENKQWPSHGDIDPITRDFIRRLRENNVSIGRVCNILGVSDGSSGQTIRKEAVRSVCASLARESIKDDIGKTLRLLDEMKKNDPGMEVRYQVTKEGRIRSMLWCTGKNRLDYARFGDVITFDTTYRTNLYNLPFGLFVGVNNHFQSVIFGGVLLTNEKISDFEWAFSEFVAIMGGKPPVTILTDQCQAMDAAIRTTLPETKHRWCSKVFEREWKRIMKRYKIQKNEYIRRLYRKRAKWAKPYFMDVFCAGMTSTQRSESANHMLNSFIQRSAPMHLFVRKFNELQYDRRDQEGKERHFTKMKNRQLRVGVPIEKHARAIYTRAMYDRFYRELFQSGSYAICQREGDRDFMLVDTRRDEEPDQEKIRVTINDEEDKVYCECGLYNHVGMLCRHALKVLVHLDKRELPCGNIMKRWEKDTPSSNVCAASKLVDGDSACGSDYLLRSLLVMKAMELSRDKNRLNEEKVINALQALDAAQVALSSGNAVPTATCESAVAGASGIVRPTQCPPRPTKKGRPCSTSLNSWARSTKRSRLENVANEVADKESEDEENPKAGQTKNINELLRE
ncbi:hypothetical protein EJB05_17644, partial [Eragrostis curvula]